MSLLEPHESLLIGNWNEKKGKVVADDVCRRIEALVREHLEKVAAREGGWTVLFKDPNDGRLWELSYPQGELQGGGPPRLALLSPESARELYNLSG